MLRRLRVAISSRGLRAPFSLSLVAMMTACTTGPEFPSPVGVWDLVTVNGESLPVVLSDDGNTVESISRGLFLIERNTCVRDATILITVDGTPQQPEPIGLGCTWAQNGANLSFDFDEPDFRLNGFIEGDRITVTDEADFVFVYERP